MTKTKTQHLHKYEQIALGRKNYRVFRCLLPNCAHYIGFNLAKGKECVCNRCDSPMILDARAMRLQKPHCLLCVNRKDNSITKLAELFGGSDAATE